MDLPRHAGLAVLCPWKGRRSDSFGAQWNPVVAFSPPGDPFFPVLLQVTRTFCQQGATVCRELPLLSWPLEGRLYPSPCWLPTRPSQLSLSYPEPRGAGTEPWPPSRGCTDPGGVCLVFPAFPDTAPGWHSGIVCAFYII